MKAQYFDGKRISINEIENIARNILKGRNIVFPTETVYGIGANAFDKEACEKIFQIKGRQKNKPLLVLISNLDMLDSIVETKNKVENKLIEKFWPGPLTIVFKKKIESNIPDVVTAGGDTIGIRMTSGKVARMLLEGSGVPIVAPSANISGHPTGTKIETIIKELGDKVDYILDYGDIKEEVPSTIVKVENEEIVILRQGKITKNELEQIAKIKNGI